MKNKKSPIKEYSVRSADWSMECEVDTSIFDDPYVEACTRCVESKIRGLTEEEDFLVNIVLWVKETKAKKEKTINTYKVLLNAGLPSRAEMFRKIIFATTEVDLANEPLSSSKKI